MSNPTGSTEQKNFPGASLDDFKIVVEEFTRLQSENKFSLFQGRDYAIRIIGEIDELVIALRKRPGGEKFDAAKAKATIEEMRQLVQIFLWTETEEAAVSMLIQTVYRMEIGQLEQADEKAAFQQHLRDKVDLVSKNLVTPPMHERGKRLSSCVDPVLEDLDIEIIQSRYSPIDQQKISSPFLRLKLRYSAKTNSSSYRFTPPWIAPESDGASIGLECDETDIDLLIARLLKAKEMLGNALSSDVPMPKEKTK